MPWDAQAIAADLRERVRGEVRFDSGSRALYATDGSNYRQVPIGVVIPKDADDVIATVEVCRRHGAPVLSRGGGTSLAGQCCNVAVVMDMSKFMNRTIEIDPEQKIARVQPGVVLDDLRNAAEQYNLTFAPDPATHNHNTLGGMIGNNSCGVHSVMGGRTSDNIHELDVLTYDGTRLRVGATDDEMLEEIIAEDGRRGEIYRDLKALRDTYAEQIRKIYPDIPRRVSGYNLDDLMPERGFHVARALVGSEGTCVAILEATVRLVDSPPCRSLLVLGYPDVFSAGDHVPEVMKHGPVGLEGIDDRLVSDMERTGLHEKNLKLLPEGGGWLLAEFGGQTREEARENARRAERSLKGRHNAPQTKVFVDPEETEKVWKIRESGLGATAHVPGQHITWPGWEDSAVPPERVGDYLRELRGLLDRYGYECDLYGHFGQGCIHTRIDFDLQTAEGIKKYRRFAVDAAKTVVRFGGSFSGEHGDGQSRGELLPLMYGSDLMEAFRRFKRIWDPQWKMNPGKVIDADPMDANLRLGTGYNPKHQDTIFQYPSDHGSFSRAMLRCVGVARCRRHDSGTMCPSYMVTREEKHSTRGRARLLFEMMQADVLKNGWREEAVKEALDLCLACKGCKGECPVNVDMATYKAEFNAHYYKRRLRPLKHYIYGNIDIFSRLGSRMPRTANLLARTPLLRTLPKILLGMPHQRSFPLFAHETFTEWFARRGPVNTGRPEVLLWPDTFNNYFYPETAKATVRVLEHAGFQVKLPPGPVCCGRALYDPGMLGRAKKLLQRTLSMLAHDIRAGVPVIGMEPACAAVFRDELQNLFPHDAQARRLGRQTYLLAEFLQQRAPDAHLPHIRRKALFHAHCNHKAIMSMAADKALFERVHLDAHILDAGCCGMAGSFGLEKEKYHVSIGAGERVLLPAVREADEETLIITDGFACREQIAQTTGRQALHPAEVIALALEQREAKHG